MLWNQEQSTRDQRMQMIGARDNMRYIEMAWSVCRQEMGIKMKKEHGELSLFKEPEEVKTNAIPNEKETDCNKVDVSSP